MHVWGGIACRRNSTAASCEKVQELVNKREAILVCPELLAGLSTPRPPMEIQPDGTVKTKDGTDFTEHFICGAQKVLDIAKKNGCDEAILKSKSPSCGCGKVFDGTFTDTLVDGDGICTKLLKENGIKVITENDL